MNFKKIVSTALSAVIAGTSPCVYRNITAVAQGYDGYYYYSSLPDSAYNGFMRSEIRNSPVKPVVRVESTEVSPDGTGTVNVTVSIEGAESKWAYAGIRLAYDPRLTPCTDEDGDLIFSKGNAVENMNVAVSLNDDNNSIFIACANDTNSGLDGELISIDFDVPASAQFNDQFNINVVYDNSSVFTNAENDKQGRLMQAYLFTQGIENGSVTLLSPSDEQVRTYYENKIAEVCQTEGLSPENTSYAVYDFDGDGVSGLIVRSYDNYDNPFMEFYKLYFSGYDFVSQRSYDEILICPEANLIMGRDDEETVFYDIGESYYYYSGVSFEHIKNDEDDDSDDVYYYNNSTCEKDEYDENLNSYLSKGEWQPIEFYSAEEIVATATTTTTTTTTATTTESTTAAAATTIAPELRQSGDMDGDGFIDASDASSVLSVYALLSTGKEEDVTDDEIRIADVDGNGLADASDASTILSYYAHLSTGGSMSFEEFLAE